MTENSPEYLLLTQNQSAIAVTCYENERPLGGLISRLDWRLHGMISDFVRKGIITGKKDEVVYVPVTRLGKHYHVFVMGGGVVQKTGLRSHAPADQLKNIVSNIKAVGAEHLIVSSSDFGNLSESEINQSLKKELQGVQLWIAN